MAKKPADPAAPETEEAPPTPAAPAPDALAELLAERDGPVLGAKLHFGRVHLARTKRQHWFVDVPAGTSAATVEQPSYWTHHAKQFRPLDLVEVFCEDGVWEATYRVVFVGQIEVKLSLLSYTQHDAFDAADLESDLHEIVWKSAAIKYAVVRRDTGMIVKDNLWPKSEAVAFLRDHLRKAKT